jgi:site-specific DNA-methyltransferase (cytosine-N4-specific)
VTKIAGLTEEEMAARKAVGKAGKPHSTAKRAVRWRQQDLRRFGFIERVEGSRGLWQLTDAGEKHLRRARPEVAMVAFSTELGLCIWGSCNRVLPHLDMPINLMVSSPPYPLAHPRNYGNPPARYIDFICGALEPVVRHLAPGGSICLNVANDIYVTGLPARSTYVERLVIALEDRFGLELVDRLIWFDRSKAPGPIQWASLTRQQLNQSYEPIIWMTNDAARLQSDNRRVLQPHTEKHLRLLAQGGERREAQYANGAYRLREGSFGKPTVGRIPRNVLEFGHSCADHRQYRRDAERLGLPVHGAAQPLALVKFLIELTTEPGQLVVDPFGGTIKSGKAAEELGRTWLVVEHMLDFIVAAAERFRMAPGFRLHPSLMG